MRGVPLARTWQDFANAEDDRLTTLARRTHPGVRHWWGRRWHEGRHGAYCYLCDSLITTWDGRHPITAGARAMVSVHRLHHVLRAPSNPPTASVEDR